MRWFVFWALVAGANLSPTNCFAQRHVCENSQTIIPGEAVGKLKLGAPIEDAIQLLGNPDHPEVMGRVGGSEWRRLGYLPSSDISVYAEDGKIVALRLGSGTEDTLKWATNEGIGIGNSMAGKARKAFGKPDGKYDVRILAWWVYAKRGVSLMMNQQGDALAVEIFVPGTYCSVAEAGIAMGWTDHVACSNFKPPLSK